jgi:hypothetical protein
VWCLGVTIATRIPGITMVGSIKSVAVPHVH